MILISVPLKFRMSFSFLICGDIHFVSLAQFVLWMYIYIYLGFLQWQRCKESACNTGAAGDVGMISGPGRSPGGGHGNTLQNSCLENLLDRRSRRVTVHWVAESWTWLKWLKTHICMCLCMPMFIYTFIYTHISEFLNFISSECYKLCQKYLLSLLLWELNTDLEFLCYLIYSH